MTQARLDPEAVARSRNTIHHARLSILADPSLRELAGARVCVIGATGTIGSAVINLVQGANETLLAGNPVRVTGISRRGGSGRAVNWIEGDIAEIAPSVFEEPFTHVIYAAGVASDYRERPEDLRAAEIGLEHVLSLVEPGVPLVFVSSTRVNGLQRGDQPLSEEAVAPVSPIDLGDPYDTSKRFCESLCLGQLEGRGLHTIIVRPSNIYAASSSTVIGTLIGEAANTGTIEVTGGAASVRNYISGLDLAHGILLALTRGAAGRAYNLGSSEHRSALEVAQTIAASFADPVEVVDTSSGEPDIRRISSARASEELGFTAGLRMSDCIPAIAATLVGDG